ncbi:hypothetical protein [uncultured Mediterranean phage]|nr:hypothetical protein [uncultured Mediterranean phage]
MKPDIETVSNIYDVSFVCSFGYRIDEVIRGRSRMSDRFLFIDENYAHIEPCASDRRGFLEFVNKRHGTNKHDGDTVPMVKHGRKPKLNACKDYDLF